MPYTLRQLVAMTKARRRDAWERTAHLGSWLFMAFTGKRIDPSDLNPMHERVTIEISPERACRMLGVGDGEALTWAQIEERNAASRAARDAAEATAGSAA